MLYPEAVHELIEIAITQRSRDGAGNSVFRHIQLQSQVLNFEERLFVESFPIHQHYEVSTYRGLHLTGL